MTRTYTVTLEDGRYVVNSDTGICYGAKRTKRQAQDLIDALVMLDDQVIRIQSGSK